MKINPFSGFFLLALLALTGCASSDVFVAVSTPSSVPALTSPILISNSPTPVAPGLLTPTSTATSDPRVTLVAVGDIMLARTIGDQVLEQGPQIVFAGVQSVLDSADVRVGNLECAITGKSEPDDKSFTLKAPLETAQALSMAGFDVLSLANNHAMDYGFAGLSETQETLRKMGIATVGAGVNAVSAHAPVIITKNGLRLAFLAYLDIIPERSGFDPHTWIATETSPGIAWASPEQIQVDVSAASLQADLVIVMLHSGIEITDVINNISNEQRAEAHAAIDAGADLVLGSHPHVLQQIERYHGGLIAYSLGNFVFDQYDGIANATILLRVLLTNSGVQSYDYVPALIEHGLPHVIRADLVPAIGTLVAPAGP
jgi:poly-gamma-glutamate capsule biosynthesis protein CapA/YwtB (metallophosphatase superfamily)